MRAQPCLLTTLFAAVVVAYNLLTCACAIPLLSMAYSSPRDARAAVPTDDAVCGGGGGVQPADMHLCCPPLSMEYSSPRDARAAVPADDAVCGGGGGVQPADMRLRYSPAVNGVLITT